MPQSKPKSRILLIDDEEYFRCFLDSLFEGKGVEVVRCTYGRDALKRLERESFDLIVVDYQLPDMNGLQILEWMREHGVATPRVMVTAYGTVETAVEALKAGAEEFLSKPLSDPAGFVRLVQRILGLAPPTDDDEGAQGDATPQATEAIDVARVRRLCARLDPPPDLSRREFEVVARLLGGVSNKEIGASLYISERTVKNHLTSIYRKLGVDGRSQLFGRVLADQG